MGILFGLFTCILIMAGVSLYISLYMGNKTQFDKVVQVLLFYVIIHVLHAFIVRLLPQEYMYIDKAAPFGLLYGPLVYYAYLASGKALNRKTILIHAIPFIIAVPFYVFFLVSSSFRTHMIYYYSLLYGPMAISWVFYSVYIGYKGTVRLESGNFERRTFSSVIAIILFIVAVFMALVVSTRPFENIHTEVISDALILYIGLLAVIFYIFLFTVQHLKEKAKSLESQDFIKVDDEEEVESVYVKSRVQDDELEVYAQKVNDYLNSKKYLDRNFNLNTLSSDLKIPKHHLSQVFSQYYGKSFLKHVNSLRIMYACEILKNPDFNSNIDDLVERCGFNSKTSFYRNFKEVAQMTPSEFLNGLNEENKVET